MCVILYTRSSCQLNFLLSRVIFASLKIRECKRIVTLCRRQEQAHHNNLGFWSATYSKVDVKPSSKSTEPWLLHGDWWGKLSPDFKNFVHCGSQTINLLYNSRRPYNLMWVKVLPHWSLKKANEKLKTKNLSIPNTLINSSCKKD